LDNSAGKTKKEALPAKPVKQLARAEQPGGALVLATPSTELSPIVAEADPNNSRIVRVENEKLVKQRMMDACKTKNLRVAEALIGQLNAAVAQYGQLSRAEALSVCISMLEAYEPQDLLQAQLAIQSVCTHFAAMSNLNRAAGDDEFVTETHEILASRATRLMRLSLSQAEMMAKLKGQTGQQKVTVEHIYIGAGGHAIVGNVTPGVEGLRTKNEGEPHE